MKASFVLSVALGLLLSCGQVEQEPRSGAQPPPWEPTQFLYAVQPTSVLVDGKIADLRDSCVTIAGATDFCVEPIADAILTRTINRGGYRVDVLWTESYWVDENDQKHDIVVDPPTRVEDYAVRPGEEYRKVVLPREKSYFVDSGQSAYLNREAIVPWDQRSRHPDGVRRELSQQRQPLHFTSVVVIQGKRHEVVFRYELVPRDGGDS